MKTLLISSLLAVSSVFAFSAPSYADTMTVTTTQKMPMRDEYRPHRHFHRVAQECMIKKVRTHHHGRLVIKETRVCH